MGLKRRNPVRTPLLTPPAVLAAMAFKPGTPANQQVNPQVKTAAPARALASEERRRRIAAAAYRIAESAGFSSDPVANWLRAEREVDAAFAEAVDKAS